MKMLKALPGVVFYVVLFIVLPRIVIERFPQGMVQVGPKDDILLYSAVLGLVLAGIYVVRKTTSKNNPVNLIASLSSDFLSFIIFLYVISLGDIASFGLVEKTMPIGSGATISFNFRIFAQLMLAVFVLKIFARMFEFNYERTELLTGRKKSI